MYSTYDFYLKTYCNGKDGLIDESSFNRYAEMANAFIRKCTFGNSDLYKDDDRMKKCECALAESFQDETNLQIGISSESVGGHSISYGDGNASLLLFASKRKSILDTYLWEFNFGRKVYCPCV